MLALRFQPIRPPLKHNPPMLELTPIPGFEGSYAVDRTGRVFSLERVILRSDGKRCPIAGRERKPVVGPNGYQTLSLSSKGKASWHYVHRLVAETFVAGRDDGLEVNHLNGNKLDNRAENLEWVSRSENNTHKYRVLKRQHPMAGVRGEACKYSTPIQGVEPSTGAVVIEFAAMKDAHRAGFKAPAISRCVASGTRTHRGLRWRLTNPPTIASISADRPSN
jgi:hypothetical protein